VVLKFQVSGTYDPVGIPVPDITLPVFIPSVVSTTTLGDPKAKLIPTGLVVVDFEVLVVALEAVSSVIARGYVAVSFAQ